eukprot:evm.model.scf_843.1 EVM.evm.TU.scf_843.1   scf_843:108-1811(+)
MQCDRFGKSKACGPAPAYPDCHIFFTFNFRGGLAQREGMEQAAANASVEPGPGRWALMYMNRGPDVVEVSFDAVVSMHNRDSWGRRQYLGVGDEKLPAAHVVISLLFLLLAAWWACICQNELQIRHIHLLMLSAVVLKHVACMAKAGMLQSINATGHPSALSTAFHLFNSMHAVALVAVLVLLKAGWTHSTAHLGLGHKAALLLACLMQGAASVAAIVLANCSPVLKSWMTWSDLYWVMDIGSFGALLTVYPSFMLEVRAQILPKAFFAILRRPVVSALHSSVVFCLLSYVVPNLKAAIANLAVVNPGFLYDGLMLHAAAVHAPLLFVVFGLEYCRVSRIESDPSHILKVQRWTIFSFTIAVHFYFTRIVVSFLQYATVERHWFYGVWGEVCSFFFHMLVGYLFVPMSSNSLHKPALDDARNKTDSATIGSE